MRPELKILLQYKYRNLIMYLLSKMKILHMQKGSFERVVSLYDIILTVACRRFLMLINMALDTLHNSGYFSNIVLYYIIKAQNIT